MTTTALSAPSPPWKEIVAGTADALIFIDTEGIIRVWNTAAQSLFGFNDAEALGHSVDLIIPAHLREAHWRGFGQAIRRGATLHGAQVRTTRGLHKNGSKLYVEMSFSIITNDHGVVLGSSAMARDVTERYLAEQKQRLAADS